MRELVRLGALPNAQDGAGATAMHWAADNGQAEAIAALVELGAVVGAVDAQGIAPLHRATVPAAHSARGLCRESINLSCIHLAD